MHGFSPHMSIGEGHWENLQPVKGCTACSASIPT
jgi:hypothetical protein